MESRLLLIHALSPLHAGTGQGIGVIDLPIAREKATNIPYLPGSTLKGVLRDACENPKTCVTLFGKPDGVGLLSFTDARLLLMPIRSLAGVFAWVTSPLLLRRLSRDVAGVSGLNFPTLPELSAENQCLLPSDDSELKMEDTANQKIVVLEDILFKPLFSPEVASWSDTLARLVFPEDQKWQLYLIDRFCLIADDALGFLLETATQITARIRLEDEKKTTAKGALWYEEALPAETILSGLVINNAIAKNGSVDAFQTLAAIAQKTLQFGGNATVGAGLCKLRLV